MKKSGRITMKSKLLIGLFAGALVAAGAVAAGIAIYNRPEALIGRAWNNTIDDCKDIEFYNDMNRLANGGSTSVSMNLSGLMDGSGSGSDMSANLTVYSDLAGGRGAAELELLNGNDSAASLSGCYNTDYLNFSSSELLGDDVYGVNFESLEDNYDGSILDPDTYDDDEYDIMESCGPMIKNLAVNLENSKTLQADTDSLSAKYRKLLIRSLLDYSDTEVSSDTIKCGSDNIDCRVVTMNIDGDGLASAFSDIIDEAEDDDKLEDYLNNHVSAVNPYSDSKDFADSFYDALDSAQDSLDELKDSDIDVQLVFYITRSGTRIARLDFSAKGSYSDDYVDDNYLESDDCDVDFSMVLGRKVTETDEMSFSANNNVSDESINARLSIKQNDSDMLNLKLKTESTYSYGSDSETVSLKWNRADGDMTVRLKSDDTDLKITADVTDDGDTRTFVINHIEQNGTCSDEFENLGLSVALDFSADIPEPTKDFTELTELDKNDWSDIEEDFESNLYDIMDVG